MLMFGYFVGFEVCFHKRKFWVRANTNFQMMPKVAVVYKTNFLVLAFHENWAGTLLEKCKQCNNNRSFRNLYMYLLMYLPTYYN